MKNMVKLSQPKIEQTITISQFKFLQKDKEKFVRRWRDDSNTKNVFQLRRSTNDTHHPVGNWIQKLILRQNAPQITRVTEHSSRRTNVFLGANAIQYKLQLIATTTSVVITNLHCKFASFEYESLLIKIICVWMTAIIGSIAEEWWWWWSWWYNSIQCSDFCTATN